MEILTNIAREYAEHYFGFQSRLNPFYLLTMLIIGVAIFLMRKPDQSFLSWLFPKHIYTHASHKTDIKLFIFNGVLQLAGVLNVTVLMVGIISFVVGILGSYSGSDVTVVGLISIALIYLIVSDFCVYWVHRLHHENPIIWPFHAVHHSAEVMTPITVYRKHPIYDLISSLIKAVLIGVLTGICLALFVEEISLAQIAGINIFYFVFIAMYANFRHSHIWISYGRWLEHIFISPAQHQIHHSIATRHWNKNYGEVLAIWDWVFGTLYVPNEVEQLEFGLANADGQRIAQPYPTLADSLVQPFAEAKKTLRPETSIDVGATTGAQS